MAAVAVARYRKKAEKTIGSIILARLSFLPFFREVSVAVLAHELYEVGGIVHLQLLVARVLEVHQLLVKNRKRVALVSIIFGLIFIFLCSFVKNAGSSAVFVRCLAFRDSRCDTLLCTTRVSRLQLSARLFVAFPSRRHTFGIMFVFNIKKHSNVKIVHRLCSENRIFPSF